MSNFLFPAEWEPHAGTVMIWPERPGSWPYGASLARPVFAGIIRAICAGEIVYLALSEGAEHSVGALIGDLISTGKVVLWRVKTDDCWARDMAPTFVLENGKIKGIDWQFNAWGGEYNGLYKNWQNDDAFAAFACKMLGMQRVNARPFVLEGGSVHSNGSGVILTTQECLLSGGRNPKLSKSQIEQNLKTYLGAQRVIWLNRGVVGDETDGHVDNICAFCGPDTVLLGWSDIGKQGEVCRENYRILKNSGLNVIKLPMPKTPVKITRRHLEGFVFEDGEAVRQEGEELAASYVNFYVCNAGVLVPQFGDENDGAALKIIGGAFGGKKIIPIPATELIVGGGNVHCLTQQIPISRQ